MVEITRTTSSKGPRRPGWSTCSTAATSCSSTTSCSSPSWDEGCPSCSFVVDNIGHLSHLHARDTSLVARLPRAVREARSLPAADGLDASLVLLVRQRLQLRLPRHDRQGGRPGRVQLQGRGGARREDPSWAGWSGEQPGTSAFLRDGDRVFHTYSVYERGLDLLMGTYNWLDLTARGRQEEWEQPPGRSDGPAMSWLHRHDQYEDD